MGPADALIFAFAAVVDLAALIALRRLRRWQRQRPAERIARGLAYALRYQRIGTRMAHHAPRAGS